jgi:L-iditol 2-dehydrogenase
VFLIIIILFPYKRTVKKGAEYVCLDLDEKRLEMAQKLGADITIQVRREQTAKEVASRVRELLNKAPNKVIECTGAESSINTGIYVST